MPIQQAGNAVDTREDYPVKLSNPVERRVDFGPFVRRSNLDQRHQDRLRSELDTTGNLFVRLVSRPRNSDSLTKQWPILKPRQSFALPDTLAHDDQRRGV